MAKLGALTLSRPLAARLPRWAYHDPAHAAACSTSPALLAAPDRTGRLREAICICCRAAGGPHGLAWRSCMPARRAMAMASSSPPTPTTTPARMPRSCRRCCRTPTAFLTTVSATTCQAPCPPCPAPLHPSCSVGAAQRSATLQAPSPRATRRTAWCRLPAACSPVRSGTPQPACPLPCPAAIPAAAASRLFGGDLHSSLDESLYSESYSEEFNSFRDPGPDAGPWFSQQSPINSGLSLDEDVEVRSLLA